MPANNGAARNDDRGADATLAGASRSGAAALARPRFNRDFIAIAKDVLVAHDFVIVAVSGYSTRLVWEALKNSVVPDAHLAMLATSTYVLVAGVLAGFLLRDENLSTLIMFQNRTTLVRRLIARFALVCGVLLGIGFATRGLDAVPRGWVALWAATAFGMLATGRIILATQLAHLERRGVVRDVVAIVGAGAAADRLIRQLTETRGAGVEVIGVFDDRLTRRGAVAAPPIGTLADLVEIGKVRRVDWIVVNLPPDAEARIAEVCHQAMTLASAVALCPAWLGPRAVSRTGLLGDAFAVALLADRPLRGRSVVVKRLTDAILGGRRTVLCLPVMACIAIAIAIESPGPILFRQTRHGWNNREFTILKFRTMRWQTLPESGLVQTARLDARVTKVGRFLRRTSLDELPQIFNVLRGDMSLVGPRPHAIDMTTESLKSYEIVRSYAHRHRMRPGITGWAQVNGFRGATTRVSDFRRRIELDLEYIENWSLAFDLSILFRTLLVVIGGKNAF